MTNRSQLQPATTRSQRQTEISHEPQPAPDVASLVGRTGEDKLWARYDIRMCGSKVLNREAKGDACQDCALTRAKAHQP